MINCEFVYYINQFITCTLLNVLLYLMYFIFFYWIKDITYYLMYYVVQGDNVFIKKQVTIESFLIYNE